MSWWLATAWAAVEVPGDYSTITEACAAADVDEIIV